MTETARSTSSPLSGAMLGLEGATALDPVVDAVQPVLDAVDANPGLRDALKGAWAGHALHPAIVLLPLGTWLSASLLDATGVDEDGDAATLLVAAGIAGAVPSALTGLAELVDANPEEKRVGVVHAAANVVGLGLQAASLAARVSGNRVAGTLLSAAAVTAVSAAGYLGGHLAVARDMGTKDPVFETE